MVINRICSVLMVLLFFLFCSVFHVNAAVQNGAQGTANDAADHIVSELRAKHFFAYKESVPLGLLKDNSIVQIVNKKGYISYFVYDGLVQTEDGKTIVLINKIPFQSQRYMTLKRFQKEYTGTVIVIEDFKSPRDITKEILKIQEKYLNKQLNSLKKDENILKISIFWGSMGTGVSNYLLIRQMQKELAVTERQIKHVEDEMIYLGFIGA